MPTAEDRRLVRLTKLCAAFPEVTREMSGRHASFKVRAKTFAWYLDDHHGDGIVGLVCKTARGENRTWVDSDPTHFYLPAYVAHRGWLGIRLDIGGMDWDEIAGFLRDSYCLTAPKALAAQVRGRRGP
jgi:hypothetical protein